MCALAVNIASPSGWKVDGFTLALLGLLILIPIAERVRKVKVTKFAEIDVGEKVIEEIEKVGALVEDELVAREDRAEAEEAEDAIDETEQDLRTVERHRANPRTIRQIVWVDDNPDGNRIEIAVLRRRFKVETARSTAAGLAAIGDPDETAVISDAVRGEAGESNLRAGLDLIEALQDRHPQVPVYVYCGQETAEKYAQPLKDGGAKVVTASFDELSRVIRADARASFEAEVGALLEAVGAVSEQEAGIDFLLDLPGVRVAVEAKDYRRTPKAAALDRTMDLLAETIRLDKAEAGLVVVPKDVFDPAQRERAKARGVRLVAVGELLQELKALSRPD